MFTFLSHGHFMSIDGVHSLFLTARILLLSCVYVLIGLLFMTNFKCITFRFINVITLIRIVFLLFIIILGIVFFTLLALIFFLSIILDIKAEYKTILVG